MRELSLFSGAGGGLLGTKLLGWTHVGYVEWDGYCQQVIAQRIRDGYLDEAPIFTDVREFAQSGAADQYRGVADVVSAGFPCQPFSVAGKKQAADDSRNMWPATVEVIRRVQPKSVLLENVPGLISIGYLGTVLANLASLGFVGRWGVLGACDAGAPHKRDRLWIVAHMANTGSRRFSAADARQIQQQGRTKAIGPGDVAHAEGVCEREQADEANPVADSRNARAITRCGSVHALADSAQQHGNECGDNGSRHSEHRQEVPEPGNCSNAADMADTSSIGQQGSRKHGHTGDQAQGREGEAAYAFNGCGWENDPADVPESGVGRVANGVASRVDRLKAIGNGQVPFTVEMAWRLLS